MVASDERSDGERAARTHISPKTPVVAEGVSELHSDNRRNHRYAVKVLGLSGEIVVAGPRDARIAAIAEHQRGRISTRQLSAAGITSAAIRTRVANAALHRLHRGVYAVGHLGAVELGREIAALLACGENSFLSFEAAAALWNLRRRNPEAPIDVTVAGRDVRGHRGIRVHTTRHLDRRDVRVHQLLPVTSPARTLLDLAEILTALQLERALDEALGTRTVSGGQVLDALERGGRCRRGSTLLRALLEDRKAGAGRTLSEAENRFDAIIVAADLPRPERNARLLGFTVDFLWREQRVVVEIDGYQWHSTKSAFERDRRKSLALRAAGFELIRVSWDQMERETLMIVAMLSRLLAERSLAA